MFGESSLSLIVKPPIPTDSVSCGPWWAVAGTMVCACPTVHRVVLMSAQGTDAEGLLKRSIGMPMATSLRLCVL